jgi:hypothetical protein
MRDELTKAKKMFSKADDLPPFERIALIRKAEKERGAQITFRKATPGQAAHYTYSFTDQGNGYDRFARYSDAWNGLLHQIGYLEIGSQIGGKQRFGRRDIAYSGEYTSGFEIRVVDDKISVFGTLERKSANEGDWQLRARWICIGENGLPLEFPDVTAAESYVHQYIADYCGAAREDLEAARDVDQVYNALAM